HPAPARETAWFHPSPTPRPRRPPRSEYALSAPPFPPGRPFVSPHEVRRRVCRSVLRTPSGLDYSRCSGYSPPSQCPPTYKPPHLVIGATRKNLSLVDSRA